MSAEESKAVRQTRDLLHWVASGRRLTGTGQLPLADARHLVTVLDTGDEFDPLIGSVRTRTRSSAELPGLQLLLGWARTAGLVRTVHGRLVPVKKNARLAEDLQGLWQALFTAVPRLGPVLLDRGGFNSPLHEAYTDGLSVLGDRLLAASPAVRVEALGVAAWEMLTSTFDFTREPAERVASWRRMTDHDVAEILRAYATLGVVVLDEDDDTVALTDPGRSALRRQRGEALPGDAVLQIRIGLDDVTEPEVWRRVQVPAAIRLGRLHHVIQAVMGWDDAHLHSFTARGTTYGEPDPELGFRDEDTVTLGQLVSAGGHLDYLYDFGDHWQHTLTCERQLAAEPDDAYPRLLAGHGACPPEDCGGTHGYAHLKDVLADPGHPEYAETMEWAGVEPADGFDTSSFDLERAQHLLARAVAATAVGQRTAAI
ncbi:plasmid pRiA4b ORF-3 family protein [Kitasatospora sp. NPDC051164]|uniref:plasmid pRiA4b ORF-3 family protein n=1 Tax=Kitasatospora sp. NPDC051164 TaxID=3364055 RepID=UPI003792B5F5